MNTELKERLMLLAERYETPAFIVEDPIRIPHRYHSQTDVEISALVTSWIATGNRKAIIRSADRIDCAIFKNAPYQYIMSKEWRMYAGQKGSFYRYYSFDDFYLLCDTLYTVYSRKPTLEDYLYESFETLSPLQRLQSVFGQRIILAAFGKVFQFFCHYIFLLLKFSIFKTGCKNTKNG